MSKSVQRENNNKQSTRRSQRRKNKLLQRKQPEYSIPNPYRSALSREFFPQSLGIELSKFDFISMQSLQNINFIDRKDRQHFQSSKLRKKTNCTIEDPTEYKVGQYRNIMMLEEEQNAQLNKMRSAAAKQEEQFQQLVAQMTKNIDVESCSIQYQDSEQVSDNQSHQLPKHSDDSIELNLHYEQNIFSHSEEEGSIFGQPNNEYLFYSDHSVHHSVHHSIGHNFPKDDFDHYLV